MKGENTQNNVTRKIFDDVFRTMVEKMPQLFIPLINEVFHKDFSEDEQMELLKNEHVTQNGTKITDSYFRIENTKYHVECQSKPDGTIAMRMFEYDVAIALNQARQRREQLHITFPQSCVLYLRHNRNTKKKEKVCVEFADGRKYSYEVPVIKVQSYTMDEIFEKRLLLFLPYYIMRYEKQLDKICADEARLQEFLREFEDIRNRLGDICLEEKGKIYTDLNKLIVRVSDYLLRKEVKVKKEVGKIMGGEVLELYSEKLIREGKEEGIKEGIRALINTCKSLGITREITSQRLVEEFNLSEEEAGMLLERHWK